MPPTAPSPKAPPDLALRLAGLTGEERAEALLELVRSSPAATALRLRWAEEAAALYPKPSSGRMHALWELTELRVCRGEVDDASTLASRAALEATELATDEALGLAELLAARVAFPRREPDACLAHAEAALRHLGRARSPVWMAAEQQRILVLFQRRGPAAVLDSQRALLERALEEGSQRRIEGAQYNLAHILHRLGAHHDAIPLALQVHATRSESGDRVGEAAVLNMLGALWWSLGARSRAARSWYDAHDIFEEQGALPDQARTLNNLANLHIEEGDFDEAGELLARAEGCGLGHLQVQLNSQLLWVRHDVFSGDFAGALERLEGLEVAGARGMEAVVLRARAALGVGEVQLALALAREVLDSPTYDRHYKLVGTEVVVDALVAAGDPEGALASAERGLELAEDQDRIEVILRLEEQRAGLLGTLGRHQDAMEAMWALRERERQLRAQRHEQLLAAMRAAYDVEQARRDAQQERARRTELEEANRELRRLAQARSETLGIVAHDLRNPLAAITIAGEMLEMELDGLRGAAEARDIAAQLLGAARRMQEDVEALLEQRVVEADVLEPDPDGVDVDAVLQQVVDVLAPVAWQKGTRIVVEGVCRERAAGNARSLREVVDNLLSNAIKFSPPDSTVRLRASFHEDELLVEVTDQGPGLSEADLQGLFRRYGRLSARPTGGEASTGLGLYTARLLCRAMGARIEAEDLPWGGAMFRIALAPHRGGAGGG